MSRLARLLLLIALYAFAASAAAQTRAWLDRDRIALGETTTLNIETDADAAPDYAPLLADFELSGQASRRQISLSNGRLSSSTLYAVALRPRRDGLLRIPALRVGGRMTAPLTLLVTAAPAAPAARGDIFIQSEADAQDPYVQQSVGWVVRLYSAVPLIAGQLEQPEPAGASLQRIGEDVQYRRTVGSRTYVVTERRYLLIPERSGELVVPPARFDGRGSGNAFDQLFGDGQTELHAVAQPRVLKVRPIPANAPQPWLPLRSLTLRYLAQPTRAKVGDAVEVGVEVAADGATASQLPELALGDVEGAQVFPERAQSDESMVEGRPRVRLQRRFSIVPTRPGTLVLHGPRIDWWDSRAGVARTATLPAITLQVAPGVAPPSVAGDASDTPRSNAAVDRPSKRVLIAIAVLAVVLVAAGLVWRSRSRAGAPQAMTQPPPFPAGPSDAVPSRAVPAVGGDAPAAPSDPVPATPSAVQPPATVPGFDRALQSGDLADIEAALRDGAGVADLDAVIARLDDDAQREAVEQLRRARWAGGDAGLARSTLRAAFARGPRWRVPRPPRHDVLPPLYPPP